MEKVYRKRVSFFVPSCLRLPLCLLIATGFLLASPSGNAEEKKNLWKKYYQHWKSFSDFIEVELPQTIGDDALQIDLRPRLRDLVREDFIRLQWEFTYGLNDRWDLLAEWSPYVPNPLRGGDRWGIGLLELGTKYNLPTKDLLPGDLSVGLWTNTPLGKIPEEIADNYFRLRPFLTYNRPIGDGGKTDFFLELEYNHAYELGLRTYREDDEKEHFLRVTPALFWRRNDEVKYFFRYSWKNYQHPDSAGTNHSFEPGIIWHPIGRIAPRIPGDWDITLSYEFEDDYREGIQHNINLKVRWRISVAEKGIDP